MKKLLGLVTIAMVCLLTACSWMFTLDTEGKTVVTVDGIEIRVSNYTHNDGVILQSAVATIEFKNTTDEDLEFKLENTHYFNKDDKDETITIIPLSLNIVNILSGKLKAGATATYTLTVSVNKEENIEDFQIGFTFNEKELFVKLEDKK